MRRAFLAAMAIAALIAVLELAWSVRAARAQDMKPRSSFRQPDAIDSARGFILHEAGAVHRCHDAQQL